jgi:hypothetical protein
MGLIFWVFGKNYKFAKRFAWYKKTPESVGAPT